MRIDEADYLTASGNIHGGRLKEKSTLIELLFVVKVLSGTILYTSVNLVQPYRPYIPTLRSNRFVFHRHNSPTNNFQRFAW